MTEKQFASKLGNILSGTGKYRAVRDLIDEFYGGQEDEYAVYYIRPVEVEEWIITIY